MHYEKQISFFKPEINTCSFFEKCFQIKVFGFLEFMLRLVKTLAIPKFQTLK
jgi:hypothetical protein